MTEQTEKHYSIYYKKDDKHCWLEELSTGELKLGSNYNADDKEIMMHLFKVVAEILQTKQSKDIIYDRTDRKL